MKFLRWIGYTSPTTQEKEDKMESKKTQIANDLDKQVRKYEELRARANKLRKQLDQQRKRNEAKAKAAAAVAGVAPHPAPATKSSGMASASAAAKAKAKAKAKASAAVAAAAAMAASKKVGGPSTSAAAKRPKLVSKKSQQSSRQQLEEAKRTLTSKLLEECRRQRREGDSEGEEEHVDPLFEFRAPNYSDLLGSPGHRDSGDWFETHHMDHESRYGRRPAKALVSPTTVARMTAEARRRKRDRPPSPLVSADAPSDTPMHKHSKGAGGSSTPQRVAAPPSTPQRTPAQAQRLAKWKTPLKSATKTAGALGTPLRTPRTAGKSLKKKKKARVTGAPTPSARTPLYSRYVQPLQKGSSVRKAAKGKPSALAALAVPAESPGQKAPASLKKAKRLVAKKSKNKKATTGKKKASVAKTFTEAAATRVPRYNLRSLSNGSRSSAGSDAAAGTPSPEAARTPKRSVRSKLRMHGPVQRSLVADGENTRNSGGSAKHSGTPKARRVKRSTSGKKRSGAKRVAVVKKLSGGGARRVLRSSR